MKKSTGITGLLALALIGSVMARTSVDIDVVETTMAKSKPQRTKKHSADPSLKKINKGKITVKDALDEVQQYFQILINRHNLKLKAAEESKIIETTRHLIFFKAGGESPSNLVKASDWFKVKKALKNYLKTMYPENFEKPKAVKKKGKKAIGFELPYQIAKRRIRETIKDYLIRDCGITDPETVYKYWKQEKPLITKKLDLATIRSEHNTLVVQEADIPAIIQAVKKELEKAGIKPKKAPKTTGEKVEKQKITSKKVVEKSKAKRSKRSKCSRPPARRSFRSRKDVEMRVPLEKAESMVLKQLKKDVRSGHDRSFLHRKIMKKIKQKATNKGLVFPRIVNEIITQEIEDFKSLQDKFTGKSKSRSHLQRSMEIAILEMKEIGIE